MNRDLLVLVAVLCVALQVSRQVVDGAALDKLKSIVNKVADGADQVAPAEQTGGLRQTAMHAAVDVGLDNAVDAVGKLFPKVQAAAPLIKKFAKPIARSAHEKINSFRKRKDGDNEEVKDEAEQTKQTEPTTKRRKVAKQDETKSSAKAEEKKAVEQPEAEAGEGEGEEKAGEEEAGEEKENAKKDGLLGKLTRKMKSFAGVDEKPEESEEKVAKSEKAE